MSCDKKKPLGQERIENEHRTKKRDKIKKKNSKKKISWRKNERDANTNAILFIDSIFLTGGYKKLLGEM